VLGDVLQHFVVVDRMDWMLQRQPLIRRTRDLFAEDASEGDLPVRCDEALAQHAGSPLGANLHVFVPDSEDPAVSRGVAGTKRASNIEDAHPRNRAGMFPSAMRA